MEPRGSRWSRVGWRLPFSIFPDVLDASPQPSSLAHLPLCGVCRNQAACFFTNSRRARLMLV